MRICFICNEYPPGPHGGIGTFTQLMARALVRAGNEVRVIGAYSSDYPAPAYEEDNGVRVWRFHGAMLAGLSGRISLTRRSLRDRSNGNHGMQMPDYLQFTMQRSRVDGTRAACIEAAELNRVRAGS